MFTLDYTSSSRAKMKCIKQRFDQRDADAIESLDFGNMCYTTSNPDDYNYEVSKWPTYILANGNSNSAFQDFVAMLDAANNTQDADVH